MNINEEDYIAHYGVLRRSGRYPWGSGGNVSQSEINSAFLQYVNDLKRQGLSETEIAKGISALGDEEISTTQLRAAKSIARNEQRQANIIMAERLRAKGYSNGAIAERMGLAGESSVRALLEPGAKDRADVLTATANMLKDEVGEKKYIDIGSGVENHLGISDTKLKTAVAILQEEGYEVRYLKVRQVGTGKETTVKVLAAPGTSYSEVSQNRDKIAQIRSYSDDGGRHFGSPKHDPISIDPNRVAVEYAETGGAKADGVIYVRPGVEDISLGAASYAQVRVKVGDGHYLKGMAMYKTDLPDGVDLVFNTNKSNTGNKLDAFKPISDDPDLPFGAIVRQVLDKPGSPDERVTSAMNIVNEEGNWSNWSKNLSSQFLSKQSPKLAREQLDMTYERRQNEFKEIMKLTNPVVREKLLMEFADGTDAASVHLKAAAMPRQGSHVILPIASMKETEVYAPNFRDGERVALVRYPHAGTFEIPELTVNNNQREAKRVLGQAKDAIGINHKVAERLSGADFDGDTVLVIPNPGTNPKIKSTAALEQLRGFDPRAEYPGYPGMKPLTNKQAEMGKVSNLITDMTIKKAPHSEIARAVKHSMVVIDAEKHGLNYKQSEIDNGIKDLKQKYQTQPDGSSGAATLVSRAKSPRYILDRKDRPAKEGGPIDPVTGKRMYVETGKVNYRTGKPKRQKKEALAVTDDAHTLSSGTPIERLYADHSNRLKTLANSARREAVNTPRLEYSPSAKKVYAKEVESLSSKLNVALMNAPRERQAQLLANAVIKAKREANPNMDKDTEKKIKNQALAEARVRTGAKKDRIQITPSEWDAIQAGAISHSRLSDILKNADMDIVKSLATPRTQILMTPSQTRRAQSMLNSGHTRAEVAAQLGVSLTTLDTATVGE